MRKLLFTIMAMPAVMILINGCHHAKSNDAKSHEINSPILKSRYARPLTAIHFESTSARLDRGHYLVNSVLRCFQCHSDLDSTKPGFPPLSNKLGAGSMFFQTDSTHFAAPNITPDKETGAGTWTDDMFVRALQNGIGHDGRALTNMPWQSFRLLSDEDLASVIVYVRSITAVKNFLPHRLIRVERERQLQNDDRPMHDDPVPEPGSNLLARGRYLVSIGECEGCHTAWYERNPGYFGGGNILANRGTDSVIVSANISSDLSGIGGWDDETFIRVMRTGKNGKLNNRMPWAIYQNMTDDDMKAVLAILKTLPPVEHHIVNGLKALFCEVCGQNHGYGDHNKIPIVKPVVTGSKSDPAYAGKYVSSYFDTVTISIKNKKIWISLADANAMELLPIGHDKYTSAGLPSPISFIKDRAGRVIAIVDYDLNPVTYKKTGLKL